MSDWDNEIQLSALILSAIAFFVSVTMIFTFYWNQKKQTKSTLALAEEINRRMDEQDRIIYETEISIMDDVMTSISAIEVQKKEEVRTPKDQDLAIHGLHLKMTEEVIPYISVLKLRLKQFGRRLQFLETLFRNEKKFSSSMNFADPYEMSPPQVESIELESESPRDIRVYYEILKQTEKAVSYKNILQDQEKKIKNLENIARLTIEKLNLPRTSTDIDTGILSAVTSDANNTATNTDRVVKSNKINKTSFFNFSRFKRTK